MNLKENSSTRVLSIDLLRGLVMVIMALDHARDYFHVDAMTHDPLDLQTTTGILFFTRWITHYCAPIFVFLSGISAYLSGLKKTKNELSSFLIKRGLWLILLEVTVITFGWSFNPFFNILVFQVIWAIGGSMIALGLLIYLPRVALLTVSILILGFHNTLDYAEAARGGNIGFLWDLLHHGHFVPYPLFGNHVLLIVYPLLPWIGLMALGYSFGKLFEKEFNRERRIQLLKNIGSGMVLLFVMLRMSHLYGDSHDWIRQPDFAHTLMSFVDVTKYPPSLLFTCLTIGLALWFLAYTEQFNNKITSVFILFGRVPFFFYVAHIYLIHLITMILFWFSGYGASDIIPARGPFWFRPMDFGYTLPVVYLLWILIVFILYFPCKWYNRYKTENKQWWLSYL